MVLLPGARLVLLLLDDDVGDDDDTFRRSPAVDARELRDEAPNNVEDIMSGAT